MFRDYQLSVLKDYQRKKAENAFSSRLMRPTPAGLKEECEAACKERFERKDEQTLRTFFGKRDDRAAYMQAIREHETEKFKPLQNYLKGKVDNPELKTIELLAWLINFERRPHKLGERYDVIDPDVENKEEQEGPLHGVVQTEGEEQEEDKGREEVIEPMVVLLDTPENTSEKPVFKLKTQRSTILLLFIMLIAVTGYALLTRNKSKAVLTGEERCMYWTGDHYEQVSCNEKLGDTLIIALDPEKISHFKRITQPDTITAWSKGKVWYVKVDNKIEFYTSDGYHPIQREKRLRPLTDYIIYKYIHPDRAWTGLPYWKI